MLTVNSPGNMIRGRSSLLLVMMLALLLLIVGILSNHQASAQRSDASSKSSASPTVPNICSSFLDYQVLSSTGASIVPGTTDIGNHCNDCITSIALPFTYTFYAQTFSSVNVSSNGNLQFSSNYNLGNNCLPTGSVANAILPYWDDLRTDGVGFGIFTSISGSAPNRIFNIEWRAQHNIGGGMANFEVRLYEGQTRFDFIYGSLSQNGSGGTVGVQLGGGGRFTQYSCNTSSLSTGLKLTFVLPSCEACATGDYDISVGTGASIVPGTSLVPGSQCDNCTSPLTLPFSYTFYEQPFTTARVSDNGMLQFVSNNSGGGNACLPDSNLNYAILAHWDDLSTIGACCGIFTSTTGVAPNRIFNIEWRTVYSGTAQQANFEVRLYEGTTYFELVYGQVAQGGSGSTVGAQKGTGSDGHYTQFECNTTGSLAAGVRLAFNMEVPCGVGATPTPTLTNTPTSTPILTPTPTCAPIPLRVGLGNPGDASKVRPAQLPADSSARLAGSGAGTSIVAREPDVPTAPIEFGVDDGSREHSIGWYNPINSHEFPGIFLNRFTPPSGAYPITVEGIRIVWPTEVLTETLVSKTPRLLVYQDPDGDGNPDNATLVTSATVSIGPALESFQTYPLTATLTGPGDIYVGFEDMWAEGADGYFPRHRPASLDDSSQSQVRSWTASNGATPNLTNLGANVVRGYVDSLGFPGNFMIRAFGTTSLAGDCPSTSTPTYTHSPTMTSTRTNTSTATPTSGPTSTCRAPSCHRILIVHNSQDTTPIRLRDDLRAIPGVVGVDFLNAIIRTPTLTELQLYDVVVVVFERQSYFDDPSLLGDNLADYVDSGGVVVEFNDVWCIFTTTISGRWRTGNYSPYNYTTDCVLYMDEELGNYVVGHPLMQRVASLNALQLSLVNLDSGATQVAAWENSLSLIAYKGRVVGVNAYVVEEFEDLAHWSGDFARVVVNAANWLHGGIPFITATPTATSTPASVSIVGHVMWQGVPAQPHALQQMPLTLTLKWGATEINFGWQVTDPSGFFTVTTPPLPNGTYNWRAKGPNYLATSGSLALIGAPVVQVELGLQRAGDINRDNVVNAVDFNLLRSNFGLGGSPPIGPHMDKP